MRSSLSNTLLLLYGAFAIVYTGRGPAVTRRRTVWLGGIWSVYLLVELAVGIAADLGVNILTVLWIRRVIYTFTHIFALCVALYGTFALASEIYRREDKSTTDALLAACGLPFISAGYFVMIGTLTAASGEEGSVIGPVFLAVTACAVLGVQYRYRPFDSPPKMGHLARDAAFTTMNEAVVVVDRDHQLVDANATAQRTFDLRLSEAVGRPLETVLGSELDRDATEPVSLDTPDGRRSFLVTCSDLDDDGGRQVGYAYVFRDVTDERTREQQLEVFNRVLRHNLRNDLDAIRGFAENLENTDDDGPFDTATVAERIHSLSSDLSKTGATAKRAERIRTKERLGREQLTVDAFFESLEAEIDRRLPDCRLAMSTPPQRLRIQTDKDVLETVLLEVVENAIEHTDDPRPAVEVSAWPTESGVDFAVRDEGAGIPEHERDVLLNGEPTQLRHSAGIGLWLVSWGVTRLGGELTLENTHEGAVVQLSIPNRPETTPDDAAGGVGTGRTTTGES
jgi:signal transduction histidine kinase